MTADYDPEQRSRNRLSITLCALVAVAVVVVSGTLQSWNVGSFIAAISVILAIAAVFWKLFASPSARPLPTDREYARWPYLSKKKMDEIKSRSAKRQGK